MYKTKTAYFRTCRTIEELKAEYKRLALLHHPDIAGGDLETMQEINAEYDDRHEVLKNIHTKKGTTETWTATGDWQTSETAQAYRDIISTLIHMQGIQIEICGSWLWITGETKPHKEELKSAGCLWSQNKSAWYYNGDDKKRKARAHCKSMDEVRAHWGSQVIDKEQQEQNSKRQYAIA